MDQRKYDPYESQLRQVFESCDINETGKLDSESLSLLCHKLELDKNANSLVQQLLQTTNGINFNDFKEAFVKILSGNQGLNESGETSPGRFTHPCLIEREVTPLYFLGLSLLRPNLFFTPPHTIRYIF